MARAPCRAVVFHELIGLPRDRAESALSAARRWLETIARSETCRPGLSPHAPYCVRSDLFAAVAGLARAHRLPLATHLAETREELHLLRTRQGPCVAFLEQLGVWDPAGLVQDMSQVVAGNEGVALDLLLRISHQ